MSGALGPWQLGADWRRLSLEEAEPVLDTGVETLDAAVETDARAPVVGPAVERAPAIRARKSRKSRGGKSGGGKSRGAKSFDGPGSHYDYARFSALAGELTEPDGDAPYRVQFKRLGEWRPIRTWLFVVTALVGISSFFVWLMLPSHWHYSAYHGLLRAASLVMVFNTAVIGLFTLTSLWILCRASLLARDPVPVWPSKGTRVAFVTTIVPSQEPLAMVRRTLEAALRIRHDGPFDVWLLDEGDDPEVKATCRELGVRHFSRHGIDRWNRPSGPFKARSKHGNYNSWLFSHGADYDFYISTDPDHVPMANMAERLLGYFRDPDVAFIVGPQVYGNYRGFVTRSAESQQFLFHSLLQRAANRGGTSMLVGTNNAVRVEALLETGGLKDSVTEDLATSIAIHSARNPVTGRRWRSVYTPDVLSVGEGPATFTDYFIQQARWSLGANEVIRSQFPRSLWRLGPTRAIHYALLLAYYPTTAIAFMLGVTSGLIYLVLGTAALAVQPHLWLMLYFDGAGLQVGLYFWNRRHNVSPHEGKGSSGLAGMFISSLTVPIYISSLFAAILRRRTSFVVTPKGDAASRDRVSTFRRHIQWSLPIFAAFAFAGLRGHDNPWMCVWSVLALLVCMLPIAIWRVERLRSRGARLKPVATPTPLRGPRVLQAPEATHRLAGSTEGA